MKKLPVLISLLGLFLMIVAPGCKDDKKDEKAAEVMSEVLNDIMAEALPEEIVGDAPMPSDGVSSDVLAEEIPPVYDNLEEMPPIGDLLPEELPPVMDILPEDLPPVMDIFPEAQVEEDMMVEEASE